MQSRLSSQKTHRTSFGIEVPIIDTTDYSLYRTLTAGLNGVVAVYITPDNGFRAIKTLHQYKTPTTPLEQRVAIDLKDQLNRELRACLFDHPSIVKIYGVSLKKNQIIMNHYEHSLVSFPLDITCKRKFSILYQLADALATVHSNGIIHSDVHPGNILISVLRSEDNVATLADFGASLLIDAKYAYGRILNPERYIYCSPEKLTSNPVGSSTDIFSLGILAYAFYLGDDLDKTIGSAKLSGNIPPLNLFATDEDSYICDLLTRCISANKLSRPTALEIKNVLKERAAREKQEIISQEIAERNLILEMQRLRSS